MKNFKRTLFSTILVSTTLLAGSLFAEEAYEGSSVEDVWGQVTTDRYANPQNRVSLGSLGGWAASKLKRSVKRTLSDRSDVLEQFNKLAHPNGICLKGTWVIDTANPYGGYFKNGSEAVIIARASTALSNTKHSQGTRAFGLAGKLFPTDNENSGELFETANFFLIEDFGGTNARHFTDVSLRNAPPTSATSEALSNLFYALKVASIFKKNDPNPNIRQVYEISELGENNPQNVRTPKWFKLVAHSGQNVDKNDFRDELSFEYREYELVYSIYVASYEFNGNKDWQKIGSIRFNESIVSNSCDHRLHFHHPKWRTDLNY